MPKRRHAPGYRMDGEVGHKPDPLVRTIATSMAPEQEVVAVAVGTSIRLLDCKTGQHTEMAVEGAHKGAVRFVALSPDGGHLLSGSDDKTAKLWSMSTHQCLATWKMHKKLSAGAFTRDSAYVLFADKFGDVAVAAATPVPSTLPELLLGHLCSIVTAVAVSPDNKFVATTDKDSRVRVSILPAEPLKGAYEIQAFGLGHKNFATSAAWASSGESTLLITGSGDGTLRLWDHLTGELLDTYVAAEPRTQAVAASGDASAAVGSEDGAEGGKSGADGDAEVESEEEGDGGDEDGEDGEGGDGEGDVRRDAPDCAAVLSVAVSRDGALAAAVVGGEDEVQVVRVLHAERKLALLARGAVPGVHCPCEVAWDKAGRLWVAGGPPIDTSTSIHLGALRVSGDALAVAAASGAEGPSEVGREVLAAVEKRNEEEEAALASGSLTAADISAPLQRKRYDEKEVAARKKLRNDIKESARLAAMRQQKQQAAEGK